MAQDSVKVTMDTVKDKCPAFEKGKACPYNVPELKGLGKGCPEFKNGCPFKGVKDVGEFKQKLGELRDNCKGKENYDKAFELINKANGEQVAKLGHCPFHKNGCQLSEDLNGKPITNDFVDMDTIKTKCPVFSERSLLPLQPSLLERVGKRLS
ncbi:uncharacterized protein LOC116304699 [Actinia tenebrosa]|uniref:Uncharacterized protein LOC116304699 n=1 Tax=Actinia tenebrosa TaxID=6105 RepID=A0A6P8IW58_ACTTE|nr:uncharacterized protein LOC116304699 [Actinia tenebrosa]